MALTYFAACNLCGCVPERNSVGAETLGLPLDRSETKFMGLLAIYALAATIVAVGMRLYKKRKLPADGALPQKFRFECLVFLLARKS